jgi:tRNA(fMet)-specific endonuclease VapC
MNGRYLPDTNVFIRILNQIGGLEEHRSAGKEVFLCLTVLGELAYGAEKSLRREANLAKIDLLLGMCPVVPHDLATAHWYGKVKAELKRKGRPIPENDIWIAATALRHDLILVTLDGHFQDVPGLKIEVW